MIPTRYARLSGLVLIALLAIAGPASAQITTGAVTGTVVDSQGGVIPGATVVLISESQKTRIGPVVTNDQGQYTVPNVTADTYTVEVSMQNFKTVTRKGVQVNGGDRVTVEKLTLDVGGAQETVTVTAVSPVIQAATGERSGAIQMMQLDSLPVGGSHSFIDFVALTPGVNQTRGGNQAQRIGGGGQDNIMLDGLSALDTGNNGLMSGMNLPELAIAEVKVLTSGYQAEYGRSSGLQVSAVTRSGTNSFHGGFYDYERNSDWNSNSWANKKNGNPKAVNKERDWGYTIGGPIGAPGGKNKLFFFYTHEYRPRTAGNNTVNYRFPTAKERIGDFSETLDNNGAVYRLIYDASTGLPKSACSATDSSACFQDGGVVGKIPINKLYGPGVAILNQYPLPNIDQLPGLNYNFTTRLPVQKRLGYTPNIRVDYQATDKLRATWKINAASARIVPGFTVNGQPNEPLPDFSETIQKFPLSFNTSATVNYTLNRTTFLEGTYGVNQNRLGEPNIGPFSNRNNVVCPQSLASQVANCTVGAIPYLFPDAGIVDPKYYEYGALQQIGTPFFQDGRILLPPQLNWGTTRIGSTPPRLNYPGWLNINRITQAAISVTRLMGRHTAKAGLYIEHSYKAQNTGANFSFQGQLSFAVDTNNPLETGYPFANAALGIFSTYAQGSRFIEGNFIYNNIEWYVQDNFKVSRKLTLDYGVRFYHDGPYEDTLQQVANFFPDKWKASNAPLLYLPGCVGGSNPCTGNNRQAMDPRTNQLLGAGTASLIGAVVYGTGDFANGMVLAGNGISKAGYTWPTLAVAPRFGAAYDISGTQKLVLRGSVGLYFDRPDGNTAFGTVANPPTATGLTQQWGRLGELGTALKFGPVPRVTANLYDSAIPKDVQWNAGAQYSLPWNSAIDVSYVGHHQYDSLPGTQNGNPVNWNAIDVGAAVLPSGQDPTQPAGTPLSNNLLRPFKGYDAINIQVPMFHRTFHSIQTSFTRRFVHGISFGANHTWAIYDKGNTNLPGPQLRLVHAPDGTFSVSPDQAKAEELFAQQDTMKHILTANFVWDMPDLQHHDNAALRAVAHVVNDWQLSGIFRANSGPLYDIGYSYNTGPTGVLLTGSPDYNARIVILDPNALGSGCSSDQYQQLKNTMGAATSGASPVISSVLAGPQVGSRGLESGRFYLSGCNDHRLDLAIQRNIRIHGGKWTVSVRADMFNVFNTVIYDNRSTGVQFNSATDLTVRNSQYLADGTLNPNRLTPNSAGFGAATGAQALRTVQGQIKFQF